MATLSELKTRIITDLNRDDMGPGEDLETRLDEALARAVDFFADHTFWFNQGSDTATTTPSDPFVARPASIRIVNSVALDGDRFTKVGVDEMAHLLGSGRPCIWCDYGEGLLLYPNPDAAYGLTVSGITDLGLPAEDDSNAWTNEGADLIAARVRFIFYRDVFRDVEGVQLAAQAEGEALAKLQRETRRRGATGLRVRPDAPWGVRAFDMVRG